MEGFIEEDKEQQKESESARPDTILIAFDVGYANTNCR
jgi:hypothetical protein